MSVPVLDNFSYGGRKPNFERDEFATIALMAAYPESKLPTTFIATVDEDGEIYVYNKNNTVDPVTGKWRLWSPGGGDPIQVVSLPNPVAPFVGKVLQYVGETSGDYTKGWFYTCTESEVAIDTVDAFKTLIASQPAVTLQLPDESTVETPAFQNDNVYYFVVDDVIYSGSMDGDVIPFDSSTATSYTTDESVAELSIEVTTYSWSNQSVSPSGGEPASIPLARIDELFD